MKKKQPIRILCVITLFPPLFSGMAIFVVKLSKGLIQKGHRIDVLTAGDKDLKRSEIIDGMPVFRKGSLFNGKFNSFLFFIECLLFFIFNGHRYDVYHIHGDPNIAILIRIWGKVFRKKVISEVTLLGSDDPLSVKKRKSAAVRWPAYLLSDAFVSLASPITDTFTVCGIVPSKVHQIPTLVETDVFRPLDEHSKSEMKLKLGIPANKIVIVHIGSVLPRKGQDVLLQAFKAVKSRVPGVFLVLVGPNKGNRDDGGRFYEELLVFVKENNLEDDVLFAGSKQNAHEYLQASDLFVFPSRKEGFGSVNIEAMSTGLACVVSELDGISEKDIFFEPETGVVVKGFDSENYAEAILRFVENADVRRRYGSNARKAAVAHFSSARIVDRYEQMYEAVLGFKE